MLDMPAEASAGVGHGRVDRRSSRARERSVTGTSAPITEDMNPGAIASVGATQALFAATDRLAAQTGNGGAGPAPIPGSDPAAAVSNASSGNTATDVQVAVLRKALDAERAIVNIFA
jgi:hypothetical protein